VVQNKKQKIEIQKRIEYKCTCCGEIYTNQENGFYISHSRLNAANNKRMTVCKNCVINIYNEFLKTYNEEKSLYEVCKLLDVCFNTNTFNGAKKESEEKGKNLASVYMTKINSLGGKNETGHIFADSDRVFESQNSEQLTTDDNDDSNFQITNEMRKRWGKEPDKDEVVFLEEQYQSLIAVYEHKTPIQIMIYEDIAKARSEANKARKNGRINDYDKAMGIVSKLMTDANIKPVQENASGEDGLSTWGEWIKKIEETEPIPEPTEEFKDVDGIWKYISKWFINHFAKIFGLLSDNGNIENEVENTLGSGGH
jgi:hypothetical protein